MDAQLKDFYQRALEVGKTVRGLYKAEVRAGTRKADFNTLREMDMCIASVEKELQGEDHVH